MTRTHKQGYRRKLEHEGLVGDRYTRNQLQVANVANQGNQKIKQHVVVSNKTCKDGKTYEYFAKTQDHHAARGDRWQPGTCNQRRTESYENDFADSISVKQTR